ncbi:hypothetical protein A2U01_0116031, partial [Trifolium medium]|nr:hypothetical protein [Trifolium medium]
MFVYWSLVLAERPELAFSTGVGRQLSLAFAQR